MQSLKELYKIGNGPSSSHTMGPKRATEIFKQKYKQATKFKVILYGSYARGDYNENSDVDIMVLTTFSDEEIEQIEGKVFDIAFDFLMEYGIDISVIVKNDEHFYHWLGALPFYNNVDKEGIVIGE